jgi:hypothetical protein
MSDAIGKSELESIKRDALSSEGKSFEERIELFIALMKAEEAREAHLTPEEREQRRRIADQLEPRPDPWWRNFRKEALAEYESQSSIDQATENLGEQA